MDKFPKLNKNFVRVVLQQTPKDVGKIKISEVDLKTELKKILPKSFASQTNEKNFKEEKEIIKLTDGTNLLKENLKLTSENRSKKRTINRDEIKSPSTRINKISAEIHKEIVNYFSNPSIPKPVNYSLGNWFICEVRDFIF